MKKKLVSFVLLGCVLFGGLGYTASAYSFNTLFTSLTGVPGSGKVNAYMTHKSRYIYVTDIGKNTVRGYARPYVEARASANRAFSGNQTWWNYQ